MALYGEALRKRMEKDASSSGKQNMSTYYQPTGSIGTLLLREVSLNVHCVYHQTGCGFSFHASRSVSLIMNITDPAPKASSRSQVLQFRKLRISGTLVPCTGYGTWRHRRGMPLMGYRRISACMKLHIHRNRRKDQSRCRSCRLNRYAQLEL
jgi:hypothetical protein